MANWSTTTKHEPSSINNGRRYELRDRVSIEQLNNMTENSFYAMDKASDAIQKAEEALSFAQGSGTTVYENGNPVAEFNADKKANLTDLDNYYTKEQVDNLVSTGGGSADVDLSNYYTKDETYSKQEVDDAISNVEVDLSSYYNKTETDELLNNKANKTALESTNSNVTNLQTRVKSLEDDNSLNKGNISTINTSLDNINNTISEMQDNINAKVDSVNGKTGVVNLTATDVNALPVTTKYGSSIDLSINETTYVVSAQLKDQDGNNLGSAKTIDLPLESVVVSGSYDNSTKKVVLTLKDGSEISFSVADLVSGLQTQITVNNKLDSDLVNDNNNVNKFVTESEKSIWNNKIDSDADNLSNYYKKSETYSSTEVDNKLSLLDSDKADKSELQNYITSSQLETTLTSKNYITQTELDSKEFVTETRLQSSISNLDSGLRQTISTKADASSVESIASDLSNLSSNLSTVKNQYLKTADISIDGKTLTLTKQDNSKVYFEGGGGTNIIWEVWE